MSLPLVFLLVSTHLLTSSQALIHSGNFGKVVVCYIGTWAHYRPPMGNFTTDLIDPTLCTHLVYAFAGLDAKTNKITSSDPFLDLTENYGKGNYKKMTSLKKRFPGLVVTLAVGGWNEGSVNFSKMAADPKARESFINSALQILKTHNFDGLDLDWEFPATRGGVPEDKENFIQLIKELRIAFDSSNLLLTAAIRANPDTMNESYDLPELSRLLDYVHLMSYDYHGTWDKQSGVNAPLFGLSPQDSLSVEKSVQFVLENGLTPEKLIVGVPMYGRTFLIDKEESKHLGVSASSPKGFQGPYTKSDGFLGYIEICEMLLNQSWSMHWDDQSQTPYAENNGILISYDDTQSIKLKVDYSLRKGAGGIMVWSLDTDDFIDACGQGRYPLMRAINEAIRDSETHHIQSNVVEPENSSSTPLFSPIVLFALFFSLLV